MGRIEFQITADRFIFGIVKEFVYLGPIHLFEEYFRERIELNELFNYMEVAKRINIQLLSWFGCIVSKDGRSASTIKAVGRQVLRLDFFL